MDQTPGFETFNNLTSHIINQQVYYELDQVSMLAVNNQGVHLYQASPRGLIEAKVFV
jgi:hypothetical protein